MARSDTRFVCSDCGQEALRWMGRCPGCGEWNTLAEEPVARRSTAAVGEGPRAEARRPVQLRDVRAVQVERISSGGEELDRVLGGGLVPGSIVLVAGSPGIGKSTLMSSMVGAVVRDGRRALYVSGEESPAQIRLRAERLDGSALSVPVLGETSLEVVLASLEAERPDVCVIDSVQTLRSEALGGAAGSVGQVREVAGALERFARERSCAVVLVGHVTKDGAIAGPRVLEHAVDCVLQFEGERERSHRVLRALKNRFGSTNEVAVFEMRSGGLAEVTDPSARFVGEAGAVPGACVLCAMEGTRPVLVEVQALVAPSEIVPPRRLASGIDRNRLSLVLAVLTRHAGSRLSGARALSASDVFVNVAGGVRVDEPGADLAVALAVASAATGVPLGGGDRPLACFGEIGLTGELRYVAHADRRVGEAMRFAIERLIVPASCLEEGGAPRRSINAATTLSDAVRLALEPGASTRPRAA